MPDKHQWGFPPERLKLEMQLPNIITLFRLALVPVVLFYLLDDRLGVAFVLFLIAGLSDALDGFLARRFSWNTPFGAFLDPIADKLLLVSTFLALGWIDHVPIWLIGLVVCRDVLIVSAFAIASWVGKPMQVNTLQVGKASTAAQIVLVVVVLAEAAFGIDPGLMRQLLIWLVAALAVWSGLAYLQVWLERIFSTAQNPSAEERS